MNGEGVDESGSVEVSQYGLVAWFRSVWIGPVRSSLVKSGQHDGLCSL